MSENNEKLSRLRGSIECFEMLITIDLDGDIKKKWGDCCQSAQCGADSVHHKY